MADARSAADGADDGEVDEADHREVGGAAHDLFMPWCARTDGGGDGGVAVRHGSQEKKGREAGEAGEESDCFEAVGGRTELQIRKITGNFR